MTGTGNHASWDAAWRQLGERVATVPKPPAPAFAEVYRDFGRWVQGVVAAAPAGEVGRHLADAADDAARRLADQASAQPLWSAVPTAVIAALPSGPMAGLAADSFARIVQWADEFAALPLLGPYRGWTETALDVQRAALEERAAAARLAVHYRAISTAALADFARFLRADDGPPIATLRALYGAWVERAEAAYAAHVMSADFAREFAAWVNAGSALRVAVASLNERVATTFDWPQRAEINALMRRQRELENEVTDLRARVAQASAPGVDNEATHACSTGEAPARAGAKDAPATAARSRQSASRPSRRETKAGASSRPVSASAPQAKPKPKPKGKRKTRANEFDIAAILSDDD